MTDFLLELRSEEIPARMQVKAKADLARLFAEEIAKAGLVAESIETFATPRRLALIARGLPDETAEVREETKGPKVGAPPQALEGFLRKTGLAQDELEDREGVYFAVKLRAGIPTWRVLQDAIPDVVRAFPWPKSMRWGAASASTESLRWVRPLQGIVALFGGEIVSCEIDGIESGAATMGHRFHHSGTVTIGGADDYVETLRAAHVLVHFSERCTLIRDGAARLAAEAGLHVVEDEALVIENAGLTEWPVPLLGKFDPAFLDVPPEVIQLTARVNQKYFVLRDGEGRLAPNFICTANIDASDGGAAIVAGNERVLSARLSDAKFFWEADLKVSLERQAEKLPQIVFHEKLGTVADKVERVAKLARWLCEEGIVKGDADLAERAARLCKADLVTGMVGEFPELQGVIGGYLAAAQGEDPQVAAAIRDHYKPVGQGDDVPTDPVTVAVSLADKLDTIVSLFVASETPTGSKDPFALRRAALGVASLILNNGLRLSLIAAQGVARAALVAQVTDRLVALGRVVLQNNEVVEPNQIGWSLRGDGTIRLVSTLADGNVVEIETDTAKASAIMHLSETQNSAMIGSSVVVAFLADRLKVQQREAGVRHDLIDAVFALGGEDDLVRLLARVKALQAFVGTDEGANLLAGYKRAANILKKEGFSPSPIAGEGDSRSERGEGDKGQAIDGSAIPLTPLGLRAESPSPARGEGAEAALVAALDGAEPRAAAAIAAEDFEAAMSALASLRAPIDEFFESVTVNDADATKRAARLALLARVRDAVHTVADFSKIEG